jgi:hypothetical protein
MTMAIRVCIAAAIVSMLSAPAVAESAPGISKEYQALKYPVPAALGTWAVVDFDGAHRQVEPYLSSLGGGESGTGAIVSPAFSVAMDTITFTICGHDGQGGGREENYAALVDAASGKTLRKSFAPGSDPMQERSWDVADFRGRKVRFEIHDGNAAGAFAWIGVGRVGAGPPLTIDFRQGMPNEWTVTTPPQDLRTETVKGGIPFLLRRGVYTVIPRQGPIEIACGITADRLFLLGCTVARGKPLEIYGHVEIIYRDGPPERYPLMYGFTLDGEGKLPSPSKALYLLRSGDQFQHYLVLAPRAEVIERIRLSRNPAHDALPRITAITCQTQATSDHLAPLPDCRPDAEEAAWIQSHTISQDSPNLEQTKAEIRRAHKMP